MLIFGPQIPYLSFFEHNKGYPVASFFYFDDTSACYLKCTSGEEQKKGDSKFHEKLQKIPTSIRNMRLPTKLFLQKKLFESEAT